MARYRTIDVVIANGASLSGAGAPGDLVPVAVLMPATWTAASLTFQLAPLVSVGGAPGAAGSYLDLYDGIGAGAEYTVAAAASRRIALDPQMFLGAGFIKVRSGTAGSAVAQGGARTLTLVCRELS